MCRDMTCHLAWNRAHDNPFMFATGSYDGAVRIWTKRSNETEDDLDNLESFDLGRNIPRTHSPVELDARESMDSTRPQPEGSSHSQRSLPSPQLQSESQGPSMKQIFRQRILAYAAAQRGLAAGHDAT